MRSDPKNLLEILETHGAELYALFTRLTLRAGVAEDLLQELFVKLQNSPGFAGADSHKAYVFRTAIHLAFDWRRAQRPIEPLRQEPAAAGQSPIDRLIDAEELEQIYDGMQLLSDLTRQCLVLRFLQQQDYGEIAAEIGKTDHQVRGLCHKGLEQLRTNLKPAISKPDEIEK